LFSAPNVDRVAEVLAGHHRVSVVKVQDIGPALEINFCVLDSVLLPGARFVVLHDHLAHFQVVIQKCRFTFEGVFWVCVELLRSLDLDLDELCEKDNGGAHLPARQLGLVRVSAGGESADLKKKGFRVGGLRGLEGLEFREFGV